MTACESCGAEALEGARFCAFCGATLAAPAPAPREERKVVSVVFVDLVGHTARSESADPEDVRAILAPYHQRARNELERFGGRVEKFIGDAVMAVFGAPAAHEDDAERAVRAALALRDAFVDEGLEVRIAVNTGEALVTLEARPEAGEAMVAGDVVNTAARLQSAAPVNGILVGEATRRATDRAIEYREAEPVAAKGKAAPVTCWEAVRPRARQGVDVHQHGGAPLVGRDAERRLLVDAVDRAGRERSLQLVTLVGAPGMGKSRLVWELYRELDSREGLVAAWRQGRALPYGGGAFGALADVLRAEVGVLETDDARAARHRLVELLSARCDDDTERGWLARALEPLLGGGEGLTRDGAFGAWQRFFELLAEDRPLVLVLEDVHWADDGTLDFVEHLADWSTDSPMLVLCTARPELLDRRPSWGGGRLNSQTISLAPLDDVATRELLARVLDRPLVDAAVQQRLLAQAGGNPLYAEEFARMVVETGGIEDLPPTVQGVIAARLDALPAAEKAFLQDAAVLGKVFWRGGVEAVGSGAPDDVLASLTRRELLRRARVSTVAGETEFAFRHALVRDVAYGQIPRAARAGKHLRAAEWIDATSVNRPDLVAHHYLEALALTEAAGGDGASLRGPATVALAAAGDRAVSLGASGDACVLYRRALELAPEDPDLLLRAANAATDSDGSGIAEALRAQELYTRTDDATGVARAAVALARALWLHGQTDEAQTAIDDAVARARIAGDDAVLAEALEEQARGLLTAGRYREAEGAASEAVRLAGPAGDLTVVTNARVTLASAVGSLGDAGAVEMFESAADEAERLNEPRALLRAVNNAVYQLWKGGRLRESEQAWRRARERTARFSSSLITMWLASNGASELLELGHWDEAAELVDEYERAAGATRSYLDPQTARVRAMLEFGRGEPSALAEVEAFAAATPAGDIQLRRYVLEFVGVAWALDGRQDEAVALARRLALEESTEAIGGYAGLLSLATGVDVGTGLVGDTPWEAAGRLLAGRELDQALELLDEMGARTTAALARLLRARDEGPEPWPAEAEAFFEEVRATRFLRELEELRASRRSA